MWRTGITTSTSWASRTADEYAGGHECKLDSMQMAINQSNCRWIHSNLNDEWTKYVRRLFWYLRDEYIRTNRFALGLIQCIGNCRL